MDEKPQPGSEPVAQDVAPADRNPSAQENDASQPAKIKPNTTELLARMKMIDPNRASRFRQKSNNDGSMFGRGHEG